MGQDSQKSFELFLEADDSEYDPLAEVDDEDLDESGGQQAPRVDPQAKPLRAAVPDDRSVPERIEDLFAVLAPRRRVLLGILRFLDAPKRSDMLQQKVEELQKYDSSVYSVYDFSLLLSEAGAIQKVSEDGSDFDEEAEQLPDIVEIDGIKFFKPTDGKQVFWLITDEGRAYLESDNPFGRLTELLAEDRKYQTIYKRLLEFCDGGAGRSAEELAALIDNDPLVQTPRKYFSYFAKKLEDCNALEWAGNWHTSELGQRGLKLLFDESGEGTTGDEEQRQATGGRQL
jgi:hypothetical protein